MLVAENLLTAPGFIILETADGLENYLSGVVRTQKSLSKYFEKHPQFASLINNSRLNGRRLHPELFQNSEFLAAFTDYAKIDPGILEVQFKDRQAIDDRHGSEILKDFFEPFNFTDDSINGREQFQRGLNVIALLYGVRKPLNKATGNLDVRDIKFREYDPNQLNNITNILEVSKNQLGSSKNIGKFDELAKFRREIGLPKAGSADDLSTLSKLEINGQEFYGISGHGQKTTFQRINNITPTHAEGDAVQQAINAGLTGSSKRATMYVDRAPCRACGKNSGLRSLARELGVDELEVISPAGIQVFTPTQ